MRILNIDGTNVTAGLSWMPLADLNRRKSMKQLLSLPENKKVRYGIFVNENQNRTVGLVPAGARRPLAPSGAALLAHANQQQEIGRIGERSAPTSQSEDDRNWALVEPLPNDDYWLVIIVEGLPLLDEVASQEDVFELLDDARKSTKLVVHSRSESIRHYVEVDSPVTDRGYSHLVKGIRPSAGQIKQVAGIPPAAFILAAAFLVLGLLWFGYDRLIKAAQIAEQEAHQAQSAAQRAEQERRARSAYEQGIQDAILDAVRKGKATVDSRLSSPLPETVIVGWHRLTGEQTLYQAGWILSQVECRINRSAPTCSVDLSRTDLGLTRTLLQYVPDVEVSGDRASYTRAGERLESRSGSWSRLSDSTDFLLGPISEFQLLRETGVEVSVAAPREITQSVTLPPPPRNMFRTGAARQGPSASPVRMGVSSGSFKVEGRGLWDLASIGKLLNRDALSVKTVKFSLSSGNAPWVLEGDYVIRVAPMPTLPTVRLPDDTVVSLTLPEDLAQELSGQVRPGTQIIDSTSSVSDGPETGSETSPDPAASVTPGPTN